MDPKAVLDWSVSYGLGTVLAIGMAFAFWKILTYVFIQSDKREERIFTENLKREDRLANIIEIHIKELSLKTDRATEVVLLHNRSETEFLKSLKEADAYQREEHKEITGSLKEITKTLVSIQMELERIGDTPIGRETK